MSSINVDGNLAALAAYERQQDRLQRFDDWLAEIEQEIWDDGPMFEEAMLRSPDDESIDDAVTSYARVIMAERIRDAETARAEVDCD
jgi:nitroimidazol reductase NimA-like FMN-containing flavoprotein (pyridoxamine 5'-phosphate oxidase superfamily)